MLWDFQNTVSVTILPKGGGTFFFDSHCDIDCVRVTIPEEQISYRG